MEGGEIGENRIDRERERNREREREKEVGENKICTQ